MSRAIPSWCDTWYISTHLKLLEPGQIMRYEWYIYCNMQENSYENFLGVYVVLIAC